MEKLHEKAGQSAEGKSGKDETQINVERNDKHEKV